MTDLDTIAGLFERRGIGFTRDEHPQTALPQLVLRNDGSAGIGGYSGFGVSLEFTEVGDLTAVNIWE